MIVSGLDRPVRNLFEESRMVLAYVLGALVVVHVLGAPVQAERRAHDVGVRSL
jgi:hypothetical protein